MAPVARDGSPRPKTQDPSDPSPRTQDQRDVPHPSAPVAPHDASRARRHRRPAVPGCDGSGRHRVRAEPQAARAPDCHGDGARLGRQHHVRHQEEHVGAGGHGQRLRPVADQPEAARGVSRLPDDRQQHRLPQRRGVPAARDRRRSLPQRGRVPDPGAAQADAGLGCLRRDLARPDLRPAVRPADADSVDAAVHRERGSGRRLLLQLLVRVHGHDQLGVAHRSDADDPRPARGVRSAVRRRRHAGGAEVAAQGRPEHPRLGDRLGERAEAEAEPRGSGPPVGLPRGRARDRAPHPEGGGVEHHRRAARAAGRAGRRARLVRGSRQADVRPAGGGVPVGRDAHLLVQAVARRVEPRVQAERLVRRVPHRLASPRSRRAHHRVPEDQHLPRQPAAVPDREAEEDAGCRRQPARQHGGDVRLGDGQLERPQPQALPADPRSATAAAR